jgi:AbrB family looped-hinge helix DNA binding protein
MNVRMDKAGRIVLPRPIRQRLGLKNGGTLTIEEGPDGITLRPVRHGSKFADEQGVLVYVGKVPKGINWDKLLDEEREARMRELWER